MLWQSAKSFRSSSGHTGAATRGRCQPEPVTPVWPPPPGSRGETRMHPRPQSLLICNPQQQRRQGRSLVRVQRSQERVLMLTRNSANRPQDLRRVAAWFQQIDTPVARRSVSSCRNGFVWLGLAVGICGELSWLYLVFPGALPLVLLIRFPGFVRLVAMEFTLTSLPRERNARIDHGPMSVPARRFIRTRILTIVVIGIIRTTNSLTAHSIGLVARITRAVWRPCSTRAAVLG